jgi:predicted transcriptional regulator
MRTTEIITISLPPDMARLFNAVCRSESRTRSELAREALRRYFEHRFPAAKPTKAEVRAIREGRADFRRGSYITLEQLRREMAAGRFQTRGKGLKKHSSRRSRTH